MAAGVFAYISTVGGGNGGYSFGANGANNNFNGVDIDQYAVDVTWEKAKKANLGLELRTLKDQVSLTVDVFSEHRTGIFRTRGDVPNYTGIRNRPWANLGEIYNKGIDATGEVNTKIGKCMLASAAISPGTVRSFSTMPMRPGPIPGNNVSDANMVSASVILLSDYSNRKMKC